MILDKKLKIMLIALAFVVTAISHYQIYKDALHKAEHKISSMQSACEDYGWDSEICADRILSVERAIKAKEKAQWWKCKPHN
jgi:hypothetical protein